MKRLRPMEDLHASIPLPGSKSLTHRALIAAALAPGVSELSGALDCEDTRLTAAALAQMGAGIRWEDDFVRIRGTGGRIRVSSNCTHCDLGNSGTSFRLLLSVAALGRGRFSFTGTPRMAERPVGELTPALETLGARISFSGRPGYPPLTLLARGLSGGPVCVHAKTSSQHLSSILLASPYAVRDTRIRVMGESVSRPYADMTLRVMEDFGVAVKRDGDQAFHVPAGRPYSPTRFRVDGDASSASYFWAAAAVTGGRVVTLNLLPHHTAQGDMRFLDVLERMGCHIRKAGDRVEVAGAGLRGVTVDMGDIPDMVPTLAAVALFANGPTIIENAAHLRYKESDRLDAVTKEWRRIGGRVEVRRDGLVVQGGGDFQGAEVNSHNDHRIAMSLAVAGLRIPGIRLRNPECVAKSFPGFWELWDRL